MGMFDDLIPQESAAVSPASRAIYGIESSGNYRALGPITKDGDRAFGVHQVMGKNIGPWTEEILGRRMSPREFLMDDKAQDDVFEGKFGQYRQKYGDEGAARAWFAGEGGMNDMGRRDQLGTSVAEYSRKFTRGMNAPDEASSVNREPKAGLFDDLIPAEPKSAGPRAGREGDLDAKPDISIGASVLHGAGQGATANFGDEIGAVMDIPVSALIDGKFSEEYEKNLATRRERNKAAQAANPGAYLAGNIGGAVISPASKAGAVAKGATFGARALNAAKGGALYGAVAGAGEGEDLESRATGAATGAAVGAATGAAAPVVTSTIGGAAKAITSAPTRAYNAVFRPGERATQRVEQAVARDRAIGQGLTEAEVRASQAEGLPVSAMDVGGDATRNLARSAANISPEGKAALDRSVNERFESQSGRFANWANENFTYSTDEARKQAIRKVAEDVYEPRYAQAWKDSAGKKLWDRDLEQIAQAPEVQSAIRIATPQLRNWAVRDGLRPPVGAFELDGTRTVLRKTEAGNTYLPSLQYWDYVKRALDKMGTPTSKQFAGVLRDKLDDMVPAYKEARASAQPTKFFEGAPNAFEAGRSFIGKGSRFGPDAQRQLARMTPEERNLFKDGYLAQFAETIEKAPDRRNVLNNIANSPAARKELETALGTDRWHSLEARVRVEGIMDLARSAVQGNSTTARQMFELASAGGVGGASWLSGDPEAASKAAVTWGLLRGQRGVDQRVARRVAEMLASGSPEATKRAVDIVSKSPKMRESLRAADQALARVGAGQGAQSVPGIQSPGTGRAESE